MTTKTSKKIFVIEDDALYREALSDYLSDNYEVMTAESGETALKALSNGHTDLILLDINLPDQDGVEILKKIKSSRPRLPVIMLTAVESIPKVVESIKLGAYDYLLKPINFETLLLTINRALESSDLRQELEHRRHLQLEVNKEYRFIGNSPSIKKIRKEIEVVGKTDTTVLIEGETGTGKELVAREMHACSSRASGPFVPINCGAIPKDLIESELFGHKKGAFTGAQKDAVGKMELASHGSLLLDEVGELSYQAQIKLLRALEQREFYPVGSTELVKVDVRVIASTNRNLVEMVEQGRFREDLFFRLNIYTIVIPPLRERKEDIITLAESFIRDYNIKFGKEISEITSEAEEVLLNHPWKGNVRELRNVIERVVLFAEDTKIMKEHLSFISHIFPDSKSHGEEFELPYGGIDLEELEKKLMVQALERSKWNKTKAAKLLNLSTPTFYYRLEKYGLG